MQFTAEEKEKLKRALLFLVKKKHEESGGYNGFHPVELLELLDELADEKKMFRRDTLHNTRYFLAKKT